MKKRNIFDLIALKERIKSNSYNQEITKLIKEEKKLDKIITQLNELKTNQNSGEISASLRPGKSGRSTDSKFRRKHFSFAYSAD